MEIRINTIGTVRRITLLILAGLALQAQDKPKKEAVIIVQITADPTNTAFRDSGDKLAKQLKGKGFDVETVLMGKLPKDMDVPSLDKLKDYLRGKLGKDACYHSMHFLGHGIENGTGGVALKFPPDSSGKLVHVDEEDAKTGQAFGDPNQFGKANFAALIDDVLCPDGEVYLDQCWAAGGNPSMAQRVADELGRTVYGHAGPVQFPGAGPPQPSDPKDNITATPTTPSAKKEDSGQGLKGGLTYEWTVTANLKGV